MNPDQVIRIGYTETGTDATGYLVAPDRILTARHNVLTKNKKKRSKLWVSLADAGSEAKPHQASIEWLPDDSDVDLAVLATTKPLAESVDVPALSFEGIARTTKWATRGFPCIDENVIHDETFDFSGEAHRTGTDAKFVQLSVTIRPEYPEGWQGISGAAVFDDARDVLIGVVSSTATLLDGRLYAAAIQGVAKDEKFRRACRIDATTEFVHSTRDEIAKLLRHNPPVFECIRREPMIVEATDEEITAAFIARCVVSRPAEEVLKGLRRCFRDLAAHERFVVRQITAHALPVFAEFRTLLGELREAIGGSTPGGDSGAATEAFAEVLLAGFDGRPCAFVFERGRGVRGETKIPVVISGDDKERKKAVAEGGFDFYGQSIVDDLIAFLGHKLNVPHAAESVNAALGERIEYGEGDRPPYYLLIPDDPDERKRVDMIFERIHDQLSELRLLRLRRDKDRLAQEAKWMYAVTLMFEDDA